MRAIAALGLLADDDAGQVDDRRQSILMAAMSEFAERGFDRCTMRDIAHVVGVTAPAIYYHFDSKETLLSEAVESALRRFYRSVLTPLPREPPTRRLEGLVRRHVAFRLEHTDLALANDTILRSGTLGRVLAAEHIGRIIESLRHYVGIVRALVRVTARPETDLDALVVAFTIANMCDGVGAWQRAHELEAVEDVEDHVWQLVDRMVGT
jgi:TetR/AcrR family transcriptional regulator, cholesterol catabolism regulator